jgi:hypothetical protein
MKNLVSIAVLMMAFSACTIEEYKIDIQTLNYTVYWETNHRYYWDEGSDETGGYYFCSIEDTRLTSEIFREGHMSAYFDYTPDGISRVLSPLPFSNFLVERNRDGVITYQWEEQLTVEFEPGLITFILKCDDHLSVPPFYEAYNFYVKLIR